MKLSEIATFVEDKISSNSISLADYVTTDSLLPNKEGKALATNLPPIICSLTHYQQGDVLVANIRPYLKKVWRADKEGGCSSDVLVFRAKEGCRSSFLYAVLLQDRFFDYAMKGAKGSKMPRGDKDQIMRYKLPTFSLQEQENIGNFVIGITNKLWLNRTINHNLEAMAKQLYDYWFVQFDFPDEQGRPYKSSGGKMVWDEKLKREIPDGWDMIFAKDVCPIITGKEDANFSTIDGQYPFFTCAKETLNCDTYAFDGSSILIAGNGDFNVKHYTGKFNAYQRTYVLIPNPKYYACLFFAASSKIGHFKDSSNGSIVKFITKGDIEDIELLESEDRHLYNMLNYILFSIEQNNQEIIDLTKLRDELLPLLMNGQVSVNYDLSAFILVFSQTILLIAQLAVAV